MSSKSYLQLIIIYKSLSKIIQIISTYLLFLFLFFIFMESLSIFEHEDKYRIGIIIILLFGMVLLLVSRRVVVDDDDI